MVRRISAKRLEAAAVKVLSTHCPDYWEQPPGPFDIELFAEQNVKATLDYAPLSQDMSILGLTCFDDREIQIWSEDRTKPMRRKGRPKLIVLDPDVWDERGSQSGRFTVAHEVSHILLHKVEDLEAGCSSAKLTEQTIPTQPTGAEVSGFQTPSEWIEWQANRFGACLLMPWVKVKEALPTFAEEVDGRLEINPDGISELATLFDVSFQAMMYRLDDLHRGGYVKVDLVPFDADALFGVEEEGEDDLS